MKDDGAPPPAPLPSVAPLVRMLRNAVVEAMRCARVVERQSEDSRDMQIVVKARELLAAVETRLDTFR